MPTLPPTRGEFQHGGCRDLDRNPRTGYDDDASTEVGDVVDAKLRLWREALLHGRPHSLLEAGGTHRKTSARGSGKTNTSGDGVGGAQGRAEQWCERPPRASRCPLLKLD